VRWLPWGGGPVPARRPWAGGRGGGRRLGSRRAGCTPGRCAPARRCVIPAPGGGGDGAAAVAGGARPRPGTVKFAEGTRPGCGQLPAQLLVAGQRSVLALPPPAVEFQHAAPHVARRAQQPEQPARWARVARSPHRAVRCTTGGASSSRFRGMRLLQHGTPTKPRTSPRQGGPGASPAPRHPAAARTPSPQRTHGGIRPPRQHRPRPQKPATHPRRINGRDH